MDGYGSIAQGSDVVVRLEPPPVPVRAEEEPPAREASPAPRPGRVRKAVAVLVLAGLAAGAAFGWKSSVDRGTALRKERAAAAARAEEFRRDKAGLESQMSALSSSLASCKLAAAEIAGIASILLEYPQLVGRAATAAASYDIGELGRVLGVMEQLQARLDAAIGGSTGAIAGCSNAATI